jgi:cation-transporting ATPase E
MPSATHLTGLTSAEAAQRAAGGLVNRVRRSDAAEYRDIVARNVLTLFNALVISAAIALFLLSDEWNFKDDNFKAAFAVSGFALVNTVLGLAQEIRAKRLLDRLTLLAESRVRAIRDGQPVELPAGDVVQGDTLLLRAGDSVVADGEVLEARFLEIDEALLTGESDPVPRKPGEQVLSGSFCVAGEGAYRADSVGATAFAQKTAAEARSYSYKASPIESSINRLIRILTTIAVLLSLSYVVLYFVRGDMRTSYLLQMVAATITAMVPQGLVLMATLAFLLGAVRMTARGALVNRLAAVEAMASIDALCMDKTGTLTTNQLKLDRLRVVTGALAEEAVRERLRLFASLSLDRESKSLIALRTALGEARGELLDQLPFKSQNRYSAVRIRSDDREFTLVLGACESLRPLLMDQSWERAWRDLMETGLRVLMFAEAVNAPRPTFDGSLEGFSLRPLALVGLSDEMRPEAGDVLQNLARQDIEFKILSGDNPDTVRATVFPLGHDSDVPALKALTAQPVVSGSELESAPDSDELIRTRHVFGRVSPWQKVQIVRTLTSQGRQVAMLGDGVNDVLPIKNARLGIAMGDGSRASKTVAGIVLTTNDFALLPQVLDEGRIIVRNLQRAGKLFLTKNAYTLLLIIGALGIFDLPFPFAPQQVTLLNFLTIGIPALLITLDHAPAGRSRGDFVWEIGAFAVWTGVVTGLVGLGLMLISNRAWGDEERMQRTVLLSAVILLGWVTLWRALGEGAERRGLSARLLRWLPVPGLVVYLAAMYIPAALGEEYPEADYFNLEPLDGIRWAWVLGAAAVGGALMMAMDRLRLRRSGSSG